MKKFQMSYRDVDGFRQTVGKECKTEREFIDCVTSQEDFQSVITEPVELLSNEEFEWNVIIL